MNCIFCGTNHNIIAAPFVDNFNKWTIHRANYVEVTFEIKNGFISYSSTMLTKIEVYYIIKNILTQHEGKM